MKTIIQLSLFRIILAAGLCILVSGTLGSAMADTGDNTASQTGIERFQWDPDTGKFVIAGIAEEPSVDWESAEEAILDVDTEVFAVAESTADQRVDWSSAEEIQWDPETRQLVVVQRETSAPNSGEGGQGEAPSAPRQPVRWDSLEQIQWDPETRTFITSERASTPAAAQPPRQQVEFDPRNYRLSVRDEVQFQVFDEPELSLTQRIDGAGQIRIPMLGNQSIAGMSVREAEDYIEQLYVENRIFRNPTVTIRVNEYASREVNVLGAVANPGIQEFPIERNQMDIVEVVSRAGGFTSMARSDQVRVTRFLENGREQSFTVDVEAMITGRRDSPERFYIQPGDTIWVRERWL